MRTKEGQEAVDTLMLKTEHREVERVHMDGVQIRYKFPNGYGASVIKNEYSYGGKEGLWEIAVLDKDGSLTYDTPIADDVIGYLTTKEANEILKQIKEL